MEEIIRRLLVEIGEDPGREGLLKTPHRVAAAWKFLTNGYAQDPKAILEKAVFKENYNEMVLVKDIDIFSMCEHHLLPFFGTCHVAYIPNGRIVGLSKIARLVDAYARRLQVQERLTEQIAQAVWDVLQPVGVGVVIRAQHLCMMMRGIEKQNSQAVTSAMLGELHDDEATRREFFGLVTGR
jgi:GTP cyclohydrolase I